MVITRTPFRISFFGGGTDYPAWYNQNQNRSGAVFSATINKYCYITCRHLPPFFEHKNRVVWSKIEMTKANDEIEHPAVREVLKFLNVQKGIEIHHQGDLPARSGLGSSSSFTVGLLHALHALDGRMVTKRRLMLDAIHIEQERLKENVGSQDQAAAAFGGLNKIEFGGPHLIAVHPVLLTTKRMEAFQSHLMMFFTGLTRTASDVAAEQVKNTAGNEHGSALRIMRDMVEEAIEVVHKGAFEDFGRLLHEAWQIKKSLGSQISNTAIDEIYEAGRNAGAWGGKLLGAGAGGFMVFFVAPEKQRAVRERLQHLLHVPILFDHLGSQVIYYAPEKNIQA